MRIGLLGTPPEPKVIFTGNTAEPGVGNYPLPVLQNGGVFYQGTYGGGLLDAYLAQIDLTTFQRDYVTYWGGNDIDMGVCLYWQGDKDLYLAGVTSSTDLSSTELPAPNGSTNVTANAGYKDAFVLQWQPVTKNVTWGTLFGGEADDAFLGIELYQNQLYVVGETSSLTGITDVTSSSFYTQPEWVGPTPVDDCKNLDGLLVKYIVSDPGGILMHGTYYGGYRSDRIWDVTSTPDEELYIVGRTVSDQTFFPLKEFNPGAPEDWYDGDLSNSFGTWMYNCYLAFNGEPVGRHFGYQSYQGCTDIEGPSNDFRSDAFIASFDISTTVGIADDPMQTSGLQVTQITDSDYSLQFARGASWQCSITDALGRVIWGPMTVGGAAQVSVDLGPFGQGIYLVQCFGSSGQHMTAKILRR